VLVVEAEPAARARGARLYGELLGAAGGGATVGLNAWPDRPEPLARVMREALTRGGVAPSAVDVVYAAANSTVLDRVEAIALRSLFGDEARPIVTSIKGAIGESGAASAAACVAALVCGRAGVVPPIAGLHTPDGHSAQLRLAREATPAPGPIVLVNGVSSGGAIVSAVLRVAPPAGPGS
jgi:3-oxoacyl-(acyl-carrier-protein) synthase